MAIAISDIKGRIIKAGITSRSFLITNWRRYRGLKGWQQVAIAVVLGILLIAGIAIARNGGKSEEAEQLRTVTLASVGELSGGSVGGNVIGSVRSVTEADILAQNGGTVRSVNARLGQTVPAGYVIAQLENAAERASVLQAEGAYDAAIAARAAVSPRDATTDARNTYRTAFDALDTILETEVDTFFGSPTAVGPDLLINPGNGDPSALPRERRALDQMMDQWRERLSSANTRDPEALLNEAESNARRIATFLNALAEAANQRDSRATADQLAALASARAGVNGELSAIASARASYRSRSTTSTASVDASVKQALGVLRGAQANLERTIVRAPIAGQVNFLPIRVGDYVTSFTHVATVAQNGALEIVAYVSEGDRELLTVGQKVAVENTDGGIITSIAPALDPVTKQIEIHVAVNGASELVNGQSVRIALPGAVVSPTENQGPVLLPLASVKLRTDARIVFTVGEDGRLIARAVEVGDVRGDRIEVTSGLTSDMRIVTDARGLSEGEKVQVAE